MGTLGLTICQWNCGWLWGYVSILSIIYLHYILARPGTCHQITSRTDIQVSYLQMNTLESCWSCGRVPQEIDKKLCCQMNPHHHHILSFWHGHGMDTLLNYICTYWGYVNSFESLLVVMDRQAQQKTLANWCYSHQDPCVINPAPHPLITAPLSSTALWVIQLFL